MKPLSTGIASRISRLGFTLVEMLVVMAIIGVLVAMLIPAVQYARERSRQASCSNHLRQIGLAFAQHATQHQAFPNGGAFNDPNTPLVPDEDAVEPWDIEQKFASATNVWGWGWAYQILPHLEQTQAFDSRRLDPANATQLTRMREAASVVVSGYYCPSRRQAAAFDGSGASLGLSPRGGLDYAGNGGLSIVLPNGPPAQPYPSLDVHESAITGVVIPSTRRFNSDRPGPGNIADGQTYTILVGERRASFDPNPALADEDNGYVAGWTWDTIRWGNAPPVIDDVISVTPDTRFGSSHSGTCIFVFADGAVHSIAYEVDPVIFAQMCDRRDKKSPDPNAL
jgi:prepilin-type N-terminal cleavage/methylation domain-containing protein